MAGYGTDLTTLTDAESGTWTELSNFSAGGSPAPDNENFIQGIDCYSQSMGNNKTGAVFSVVFDSTADQSGNFNTDDVVLIWQYFAVGANLNTYATGGMRVFIHSGLADGAIYYTGGSDRTPYPYGAWQNVAIDPTRAADQTDGAGNAGSYRYFGTGVSMINAIGKGTPHACDAIRYGRGEIFATGATCNFSGMSTYNDYNDATNGYNRFGLFQDTGGNTYLWKGLMSFGQTNETVTFEDSNKLILIDDAARSYTEFNKIQILNTGSSVTLTNISFTALGTESPGTFIMTDNATGMTFIDCTFTDLYTFIFQSNAVINGSTFRRCSQVTQSGATFNGAIFDSSVATDSGFTAALLADDPESISNCEFIFSDGHGIEITTTGTSSFVGNTFTGAFSGATGSNLVSETGSVNAMIYNNSGGLVTLNVSGGDTPSIRNGVSATTQVNNTVAVTITGLTELTEVRVYTTGTNTELAGVEDAIDGSVDDRSFTFSLDAGTTVDIVFHNKTYDSIPPRINGYVVPSAPTTFEIVQLLDPNYNGDGS
jgi:hypothetical protein